MLTFQQGTGHSTQHIVGSVFAEVGTEKKKQKTQEDYCKAPCQCQGAQGVQRAIPAGCQEMMGGGVLRPCLVQKTPSAPLFYYSVNPATRNWLSS